MTNFRQRNQEIFLIAISWNWMLLGDLETLPKSSRMQLTIAPLAAFGRHRRSSPKLVRVSLWETVERVTASKELINRPFRGFPEEASIVAKNTPRLLRSYFLSGARSTFVMVQDFFHSSSFFFLSFVKVRKKNFYQT